MTWKSKFYYQGNMYLEGLIHKEEGEEVRLMGDEILIRLFQCIYLNMFRKFFLNIFRKKKNHEQFYI